METFPKINAIYKRYTEGKKKGKLITGEFAAPEFEYLFNNQWEFTEKVDGTNIRVKLFRASEYAVDVQYGGRTNNADIPEHLLTHLEKVLPTYPSWRRLLSAPSYGSRHDEILAWMNDNNLDKVMLFGEGYGPKIQSGGKYRDDASFVLFDVKIGDFWLDRDSVNDIATKLGIDAVPVLGYGTLQDVIDIVSSGLTWDKNGHMTNWGGTINNKRRFAGLKSTWGDFESEGIVARPVIPLFNRKGERIICKVKGVDFK